jgi:hypothetical protein
LWRAIRRRIHRPDPLPLKPTHCRCPARPGSSCAAYKALRPLLSVLTAYSLHPPPPPPHTLSPFPQERTCEKAYVARVVGRFPACPAASQPSSSSSPASSPCTGLPGVSWVGAGGSSEAQAAAAAAAAGPALGPATAAQSQAACGAASQSQPSQQVSQPAPGSDLTAGTALLQVDVPLTWDPKTNTAGTAPPAAGPAAGAAGASARPALEAKHAVTQFRWVRLCHCACSAAQR